MEMPENPVFNTPHEDNDFTSKFFIANDNVGEELNIEFDIK